MAPKIIPAFSLIRAGRKDLNHLITLGVGHLLLNLCATSDLGENTPFHYDTISKLKKNRELNMYKRSTDNKERPTILLLTHSKNQSKPALNVNMIMTVASFI